MVLTKSENAGIQTRVTSHAGGASEIRGKARLSCGEAESRCATKLCLASGIINPDDTLI